MQHASSAIGISIGRVIAIDPLKDFLQRIVAMVPLVAGRGVFLQSRCGRMMIAYEIIPVIDARASSETTPLSSNTDIWSE